MQMTPNHWDRVKELFEAALELEPSQRTSFLAANCHEECLQQQVEKLLVDYQAAGNFLDEPALHATETTRAMADPMLNRRLGAYQLVRQLGQGGMAAVFLAVRADEEYQKEVAVKLVQPGFDSRDVMTRFRSERQTLAGLDHPNIVRLLDGGSTPEGWPYLVMEFVEGQPIDKFCDQHRLSVDDRLRLFGEVCDAVQYAHEKLVIHRDLKPSNILVGADGTPKLLDFGIAKVLNPEPGTQSLLATQTSARCMTPAYASPEQMRGKAVTPETDVYSLGVVLYELLTGHRPYRLTQNSPAEIERAICEQELETPSTAVSRVENDTSPDGKPITKTPQSVSLTREGEPEKLRRRLRGDLDNIVLKALQKEPKHRYGSVAEFSQDIDRHLQHQPVKARPSTLAYRVSKFAQRHKAEVSAAFAALMVVATAASFAFNTAGVRDRLAGDSTHMRIQSLAVIPFVNVSRDPAQEYFSDGITDALITDLAEMSSLKVISGTSSTQYKGAKKTLPEIASELGADGIIEGTVQRSGDRVRITAQLIHGPSNKQIWANSYERDMRDMFVLERDVTEEIIRQAQSNPTTPEQRSLHQPRLVDPKVLEAYLQGNYHLGRYGAGFGQEEQKKAAKFFQQAIDGDPNFAPAYVGLANAHRELLIGSSEDVAISKKSLEKAIEVDPDNSDAHAWLGWLKWQPFLDWQGAESEFRRAIALNPNNADGHGNLGVLLVTLGRTEEGLRESRIGQQLDPNSDQMSGPLYLARDYDGSIAHIRIMLQKDPNNGQYHAYLSANYLKKHMLKEAVEELAQYFLLFGEPKVADHIRHAYDVGGYRRAIQQGANEIEHLHSAHRAFLPGMLAKAYAILGDKDRAFYWLEQAYEHREMSSTDDGVYFLPAEPLYDPLRSDPRYDDLLRRIGLPPLNVVHAPAPQIHSLAVLPLQNLSGDPNQEYFSDGMTDALITYLAEGSSLKVISRASIMRYKKTDKTLPQIARELGVEGIIEGTVQRSGGRVRVTAQLIHASLGKQLWANSYERDMRDVFALEQDVTQEIARQVHARLGRSSDAELAAPLQVSPKAFDAYLMGNYFLTIGEHGFNDEEKKKATEYFQKAIDADPNFAPAYIGLANAHDNRMLGSSENAATMKKAAEKALSLDPKSSDALVILGTLRWHDFDWSGGEQEFRRAVEFNPNSAHAHHYLGELLAATGHFEEAMQEAQTAQVLDPNGDHLPIVLEMCGEYGRATELLLGMARGSPEDGMIYYELFRTYTAAGKRKEAIEAMEKALVRFRMSDIAADMQQAFSVSGYSGAIRELAKYMEQLQASDTAFLPENLAAAYTALGEKDRAFYWLEQGYVHHEKVGHDWGLHNLKVDPMLAPLHSDARFADLLRRIGLPSSDVVQAPAPEIQSLAVLPLANLSRDPAQEYFSDGMTDLLITDLAQIRSVKVISRTSSMRYKHSKKKLPQIAHELNVDGIIEGTVQRSGDRVRITAHLIQAATDKHVWTNSYEGEMSDFFVLEREVALDIASQIQTQLTAQEQTPITSAQHTNLKALESYLQGNFHLTGYATGSGDEEKKRAAEYFKQAIEADPNFAPAFVGLARCHFFLNWPTPQDAEIATRAVKRALELDPNSSDPHVLLAEMKDRAWEFPKAEDEFRRAIALNPSNADAHDGLAWSLDESGRWEEGWKEHQIAQELDPAHDYLSGALGARRQIGRAIENQEHWAKRFPDDGYLHVSLFRAYLNRGLYDDAQAHLERLWTLFGFPQVTSEVHKAFLAYGFEGSLRASTKEMEHLITTNQFFLPLNLAELYAALGDKDRAFYWLEQSYSQHDIGAFSTDLGMELLNTEYLLDPLRSDPRFKDLLRRVGLPDLQLTDLTVGSAGNGQN